MKRRSCISMLLCRYGRKKKDQETYQGSCWSLTLSTQLSTSKVQLQVHIPYWMASLASTRSKKQTTNIELDQRASKWHDSTLYRSATAAYRRSKRLWHGILFSVSRRLYFSPLSLSKEKQRLSTLTNHWHFFSALEKINKASNTNFNRQHKLFHCHKKKYILN